MRKESRRRKQKEAKSTHALKAAREAEGRAQRPERGKLYNRRKKVRSPTPRPPPPATATPALAMLLALEAVGAAHPHRLTFRHPARRPARLPRAAAHASPQPGFAHHCARHAAAASTARRPPRPGAPGTKSGQIARLPKRSRVETQDRQSWCARPPTTVAGVSNVSLHERLSGRIRYHRRQGALATRLPAPDHAGSDLRLRYADGQDDLCQTSASTDERRSSRPAFSPEWQAHHHRLVGPTPPSLWDAGTGQELQEAPLVGTGVLHDRPAVQPRRRPGADRHLRPDFRWSARSPCGTRPTESGNLRNSATPVWSGGARGQARQSLPWPPGREAPSPGCGTCGRASNWPACGKSRGKAAYSRLQPPPGWSGHGSLPGLSSCSSFGHRGNAPRMGKAPQANKLSRFSRPSLAICPGGGRHPRRRSHSRRPPLEPDGFRHRHCLLQGASLASGKCRGGWPRSTARAHRAPCVPSPSAPMAGGSQPQRQPVHCASRPGEWQNDPDAVGAAERLVTLVKLSPDGKQVLSGSADGTVRLWDSVSGEQKAALRGHGKEIASAELCPDGRRWSRPAAMAPPGCGASKHPRDCTRSARPRGQDPTPSPSAPTASGCSLPRTTKALACGNRPLAARCCASARGRSSGPSAPARFSPDGTKVVTAFAKHLHSREESTQPQRRPRLG